MSEMVERVARAIESRVAFYDDLPEDVARAAIVAFVEPLAVELEKIGDWVAADVVRDIIRAALAEKVAK